MTNSYVEGLAGTSGQRVFGLGWRRQNHHPDGEEAVFGIQSKSDQGT